jgi:hypothetical protein
MSGFGLPGSYLQNPTEPSTSFPSRSEMLVFTESEVRHPSCELAFAHWQVFCFLRQALPPDKTPHLFPKNHRLAKPLMLHRQ